MTLLELQILFQQKITDVNPVFEIEQRPDTYTIVNYLNRTILEYLKTNFLNQPTFEQQLLAIYAAGDDLRFLIRRNGLLEHPYSTTTHNWGDRAKRYRLPDDILILLSITTTITRTEVMPMTDQKMFVEFRSRLQAEKLVKDSQNQVIHVKPIAFIEDEFYVVVVGDAYITSITADNINYLRKPDKLSFDYNELTGTTTLDITSIGIGTYIRALTALTYVNVAGTPTNYIAGEKFIKVAGYNSISELNAEQIKIGYPWGYTDTPNFPEYMHEDILNRATQLFLEEAKLKLITKE